MANMVQNFVYRVSVSAIVGAAVAAGVLFLNTESKYGQLQSDLVALQNEVAQARAEQASTLAELTSSIQGMANMQSDIMKGFEAQADGFSTSGIEIQALKDAIAALATQTADENAFLVSKLSEIEDALKALNNDAEVQ